MNLKLSLLLAAIAIPGFSGMAQAANPADLEKLWNGDRQCDKCDLSQADLSGQDLSGFQLVGANLNGANLVNTNLSRANLGRASVVGANLPQANLSQSNLTGATFVYSNLAGVNMRGAKVLNVDFRGANLAGIDLSNSQVRHSSFAGIKELPRSIVRHVAGSGTYGNIFTADALDHWQLAAEGEKPQDVTIDALDSTLESGSSYRRPRRTFKVPAYIGTAQRSSVAGDKSHKDLSFLSDW